MKLTMNISFNYLAVLVILSLAGISCETGTVDTNKDVSGTPESIEKEREDSIQKVLKAQIVQDSLDDLKIKGYQIKKIAGIHKYGGSTKVSYKSKNQLIEETQALAIKEMWTDEQRNAKLEGIRSSSTGGQIRLDIERITIGAANTDMFTVIIKDLEENELMRKSLGRSVPETPISNDYWWNIALVNVDARIRPPFYVYIVDKLADQPFKFEIAPVYK